MNIQSNYECLVKILILGDTGVGKSNFLLRYTDNSFSENHITTIGFDYKSKNIKMDDEKTVKLQIWDTAGQERFMSVTKNLLLRVQGIILMYDVTEPKTFENVKKWIISVRESTNDKLPIVIVGNKVDLQERRKISTEKGKEIADQYKLEFFESSVKLNKNIKEVFKTLTEQVMRVYSQLDNKKGNSLDNSDANNGGCFC